MAGATVDTATGITVVFATSAFTAEIKDVNWGGISRESKDISKQSTAAPGANKFGNMEFMPGDLSDPGELSMEIHFDPDQEPPIDQAAEVITVTWPLVSGDSTAATWAATGFITAFEESGTLDEVMTASITVKFSGEVTMVAAA